MERYNLFESAIGPVLMVGTATALTQVHLRPKPGMEGKADSIADSIAVGKTVPDTEQVSLLVQAQKQFLAYLAGELREFTIPMQPAGTEFQRRVWDALCEIPYGETRSYGQIAARIGKPGAARAVGMANNRNPISVLIPCHRVIGANGALVGYGGGLDIKQFLLDLEGYKPSA